MRDIERRLEKIENKLNNRKGSKTVDTIQVFGVSSDPDEPEQALPENVEGWLTYQEQLQKDPDTKLIVLYSWEEAKARKQQKATELNKKTEK